MRALRQYDHGAGRIITAHEGRRYASYGQRRWQPGDAIAAPLQLFQCGVDVNWIDYNGHMTESSYLAAFGDASDALFRYLGIDEAYRAAGFSYYTVETHINYYRECGTGDTLAFTTQILNYDAKRLHLFHTMNHAVTGARLSTTEQMLLHVDTAAARTAPIQPHVANALAAIFAVHREMGRPGEVGRVMGVK
ncbi:MAG: thioesterase family protein [Ardenticatenales bacterium]|nr:thioesterase family protein [Ardenticatenales bacterium]